MIEEIQPDIKVCQTMVFTKDKTYWVSTIERSYFTIEGESRGHETLVWECDPKPGTLNRGDLVYQAGHIMDHFEICKNIIRGNGPITDEDLEEKRSWAHDDPCSEESSHE